MALCTFDDCDLPARADRLCKRHYQQQRRSRLGACSIDRCERLQQSAGLCPMHYERRRTSGEVGASEPEYARGSARSITSDGYVRLYRPGHPMSTADGWILEHRLVAFEAGWLTGPDDPSHVHHLNEVRTDNRKPNLQVLSASEHAVVHARARSRRSGQFLKDDWKTANKREFRRRIGDL